MHLYEHAIRSAHANGFVHNEALANEVAARFYAARGFEKIADAYLQDARYGYHPLGSRSARYGNSTSCIRTSGRKSRLPAPQARSGHPVEQLDLSHCYQSLASSVGRDRRRTN